MKRSRWLGILLVLVLVSTWAMPVLAATDADVDVTATPAYVTISCDQPSYDFGVVAESATPSTATNWATITNGSTVQTDQTIGVTTSTWAGGVTWTHSDTNTPGADTAGMLSNKGGTWGVGDVIVKYDTPNYIAENQAATTNYSFGLKLSAPTTFTDGVEKSITVRVSAAAG